MLVTEFIRAFEIGEADVDGQGDDQGLLLNPAVWDARDPRTAT